jgi:hypothetical protein
MSGTNRDDERRAPTEKPALKGKNADECDLSFDQDLSALRAPFRQLSVGDILDVDLIQENGLEAAVCRRKAARDVVGSLAAFEGLAKLMDCIRRGNVYAAEVRQAGRTTCSVRVRRVTT